MHATLIGYFPKITSLRPDGLKAEHVAEICSVSDCISSGPEDWIDQWKHNGMWVFDSPEVALSVIPEKDREKYDMYAYRLFPFSIKEGKQIDYILPTISPIDHTSEFEWLGIDVVSRSCGSSFECSPLSCNYMADAVPTNSFCLFDDAGEAVKRAFEFEAKGCEPGPYFVVEVLRKKRRPNNRPERNAGATSSSTSEPPPGVAHP